MNRVLVYLILCYAWNANISNILVRENEEAVINYEFVVSKVHGHWKMRNSSCSTTCGNGTLISYPVCVNSTNHLVDTVYCTLSSKPVKRTYSCSNRISCIARWYTGEWTSCNLNTCEEEWQQREVYCIVGEKKIEKFLCSIQNEPEDMRKCIKFNCLYFWFTGPWTKCRGVCSRGFQTRSVTCRRSENGTAESFSNCNKDQQPPHMRKCRNEKNCYVNLRIYDGVWITSSWSECDGNCGNQEQIREVTCVSKLNGKHNSPECDPDTKPPSRQLCTKNCIDSKYLDCEDHYEWCPVSTNERLCGLKFYITNCCKSCRKKL